MSSPNPQMTMQGAIYYATPKFSNRPQEKEDKQDVKRPLTIGQIDMLDNLVLRLNEDEFQRVIDESQKNIVIVNIWAPWCKACDKAQHIFYNLVNENKDKNIKFIKYNIVNGLEGKQVFQSENLKALPSIRAYKNGVFTELVSTKSTSDILETI